MLLRICLIITIVAGLGAAYLGFFPVKDIITTTREARDDFNNKWKDETALYLKTDKALKKTTADLASTTAKLTETQGELDAANTKNTDLTAQNSDLTDKLAKMTTRADTAEQTLEKWNQLPPPEQIKSIIAELAQTKKERDGVVAENKILVASRKELQNQIYNLIGSDATVLLPEGLKGRVLAVDPKYDFVVLDIGDDQGVKERGEMMVNRQGKLIGKVRITRVEKDRSVATILSNWKRGQVMEGDQVIY
jgi:hypothetical protein